jgi:hypothetical protein
MSVVTGPPLRRCNVCRLSGRDSLHTVPSGVASPFCRTCTLKLLVRRKRPVPPNATGASPDVRGLRATGHDHEAPRDLRIFALSVLEDKGQADDTDLTRLRLLEYGATDSEIETEIGRESVALTSRQPTPRVPSGATGAPLRGPVPSWTPPDAPGNREPGRSADGETTDGQDR